LQPTPQVRYSISQKKSWLEQSSSQLEFLEFAMLTFGLRRFDDFLVTYKLDNCHAGCITLTNASLQNSGITAITFCEFIFDIGKKFLNDGFAADECRRLSSGVEIASFGKRDHLLGYRSYFLCFFGRRNYTFMLEEGGDHIPEHRYSVRTGSPQSFTVFSMSHF
jgi:hypothetical protein